MADCTEVASLIWLHIDDGLWQPAGGCMIVAAWRYLHEGGGMWQAAWRWVRVAGCMDVAICGRLY